MRLKQYINETTKTTVVKSKIIIQKHLPEIMKEFEKENWIISDKKAIDIINKYFKRDNIEFELIEERIIGKSSKNIAGGVAYSNGITIYPVKGFAETFRRYAKPDKKEDFLNTATNKFFGEIHSILTHELIHIDQYELAKGKMPKKEIDTDKTKEYLSDKQEIEAFAQQAALEIARKGKSNIITRYKNEFKPTDKVWKRFMKKFFFYMIS